MSSFEFTESELARINYSGNLVLECMYPLIELYFGTLDERDEAILKFVIGAYKHHMTDY